MEDGEVDDDEGGSMDSRRRRRALSFASKVAKRLKGEKVISLASLLPSTVRYFDHVR